MMKCLVLAVALFSSTSFAASSGFEMKMELSIDGKLVSSPKIIAVAGQKASIAQRQEDSKNGTFIEVVAIDEKVDIKGETRSAINMSFVVGTIDADGKKTILATPRILATENEKAEISVGDAPGKEKVALSVVAQRKNLQE